MSKRVDLTEKVFGDLKVIEFSHQKNTHAMWDVKCLKCGSITKVSATNLKSGNSKGCRLCRDRALKKSKYSAEQRAVMLKERETSTVAVLAEKYDVSRQVIRTALRRALSEKMNAVT